jgi:predicted ATP-grasp superfamily ATP-dependent carboligase
MEWPALELFLLESTTETDVLVLHGPEPDHEWRAFAEAVVDLCRQLGVQMVVGLGAYPAAVPHTRPTRLSCTAGSADLTERLDFVTATVEVPAGVQAVIEMEAGRAGIPAIGLWAQVPHYLSATSYPPAALALLAGLAQLSGATVDDGPLSEASLATRARLDDLVARNPEHVTMLEKLEAAYDDLHDVRGQLPDGDQLAAELERFLRSHDDG